MRMLKTELMIQITWTIAKLDIIKDTASFLVGLCNFVNVLYQNFKTNALLHPLAPDFDPAAKKYHQKWILHT